MKRLPNRSIPCLMVCPRSSKRSGLTFIELIVVLAILGIVIASLLPAVRTAREPARRTQCKNNLKQICMALNNYESTFGVLPPAYTVDSDGKPLHSWRTLILPFLDQQALYDTIDLSKPWDDPANAKAYVAGVETYHCASANLPKGQTTYLAVVTPESSIRPTKPRAISEVVVPSKTIMILEAPTDQAVHWMSPKDANEQTFVDIGPKTKLNHNGGIHAADVDGSLRFVPNQLSPEQRRALISSSNENKSKVDW